MRIAFLFGVCVLGGACFWHHLQIQPSDKALYAKLMHQTKELRSLEALQRHPSYQERSQVDKEIWKMDGEERVSFRVHSDLSTLSLTQDGTKDFQIVEKLEGIVCSEEAKGSWLHADKGLYSYPALQMHIESVQAGHPLGTLKAGSAYLDGENKDRLQLDELVEFIPSSLDSKTAISSQKALCDWENSTIEFLQDVVIHLEKKEVKILAKGGKALYQEQALTLSPEEGLARCVVYNGLDQMDASEIVFDLKGEEIHCFDVTGQMRSIQNKESFFIADQVVYRNPETLILSAKEPATVLFWQDGCSLSAPIIEITKDPVTLEKVVQGHGDVRFTLTVEEQNIMNRLISQYL